METCCTHYNANHFQHHHRVSIIVSRFVVCILAFTSLVKEWERVYTFWHCTGFLGINLLTRPLMPLFWNSGDVCPGFQSQGRLRFFRQPLADTPLPLTVKFLPFSFSFREKIGQIIAWHPQVWSSLGNPGSTTGNRNNKFIASVYW